MSTQYDLVEWQIRDKDNGMVMPWFVHTQLEWMKSKDFSSSNVIMFGAGLGDAWLAKKCRRLYIVERSLEWLNRSKSISDEYGVTNIDYIHRPCNDSSGMEDFYVKLIEGEDINVIINDDAYRTEICQMAVDYFTTKENGGILICDNWVQSFVWLSPKAEEIMKPYESLIFEQKDHTNNDGVNKWKTAVFFINCDATN